MILQCASCHKTFVSLYPDKVPTLYLRGGRRPVCRRCVEGINWYRYGRKMKAIQVSDDAYQDDDFVATTAKS